MSFEDALKVLVENMPSGFEVTFEDLQTSVTLSKRGDGIWQVRSVKHQEHVEGFLQLENAIAYLAAKLRSV